jgi:hypothetical protein
MHQLIVEVNGMEEGGQPEFCREARAVKKCVNPGGQHAIVDLSAAIL